MEAMVLRPPQSSAAELFRLSRPGSSTGRDLTCPEPKPSPDSRSQPCPLLRRLTASIRSESLVVQALPISGHPSFAKPDFGDPDGAHQKLRA